MGKRLCLESTAWGGQISTSADQSGAKTSPSVSVSVTIYITRLLIFCDSIYR